MHKLWRHLTKWLCDTSLRSKYRDCVHRWKQLFSDDQLKANVFNNYFASIGISDNSVMPACCDVPLCSTLDSIFIDPASVASSINKLKR